MVFPADLTPQEQARMAAACRDLAAGVAALRRDLVGLDAVKRRFLALNLDEKLGGATDYAHAESDAPTVAELGDLSALIDYLQATVLGEGAPGALTAAQARAIVDRYATR